MQKVVLFKALSCAMGVHLPLSGQPLKVFAATFNAGNSIAPHTTAFEGESGPFRAARDAILEGSGDADIVVVGLQEFRDRGENQNKGEDFTWAYQETKAFVNDKDVNAPDTESSLFAPTDPAFENFRVTYYSGLGCHSANHYNTALYVRVPTSSAWLITHKTHGTNSSDPKAGGCINWATRNHGPKLGCSIDNNRLFECGKVVNMLVFEIRSAPDGLLAATLCVMNTHMSFAGTAKGRMIFLAGAMAEADKAECDHVVFVGDFNTRLHCHGGEAHVAHPKGQTVKAVLGEFGCDGGDRGTCNLEGRQHRDELRQFLTRDTIHCHEKKGGSEPFVNTVPRHEYKEPKVPEFYPSYKLKDAVETEKLVAENKLAKEWRHCREGEAMCIANKDGDPKHNPAWTDRILVKGNLHSGSDVMYERRVVAKGFKTDHAAVVAKFAFSV